MALWCFQVITSFSDTNLVRHSLGASELGAALTMEQFWAEM